MVSTEIIWGKAAENGSMGTSDYDVIVVGASFAGLAVVSQLRARVLLIERFDGAMHHRSRDR